MFVSLRISVVLSMAADTAPLHWLRQVKGVIQFIVNPGGAWVVDLKNGSGSVTEGKASGKVDMTLTVSDADMVAIASGKLNPQQVRAFAVAGCVAALTAGVRMGGYQAFMRGKLKVKGNMGLAMVRCSVPSVSGSAP